MKKTNNKGFSLVELIVVIAIMAVLIGVLAPTFTKYVEQARRSTDIQNAEEIKQAILADIADGTITSSATSKTIDATFKPSTMSDVPKIQGSINKNGSFTVDYDAVNGSCDVYNGTYKLTDPAQAATYKTAGTTGSSGSAASGS